MPQKNTLVADSHMRLLDCIDQCRSYNWAKYAFLSVVNEIRNFRLASTHMGTKSWISGCVLILQVLYLEHIAISLPRTSVSGHESSTMKYWDDNQIREVLIRMNKLGGLSSTRVIVLMVSSGSQAPFVTQQGERNEADWVKGYSKRWFRR